MKNLFSFATRELSQDAFLRWLLENYDSTEEDVRTTSNLLIKKFLGIIAPVTITYVKTYAQLVHTDVCAKVKLSDGKVYVVRDGDIIEFYFNVSKSAK